MPGYASSSLTPRGPSPTDLEELRNIRVHSSFVHYPPEELGAKSLTFTAIKGVACPYSESCESGPIFKSFVDSPNSSPTASAEAHPKMTRKNPVQRPKPGGIRRKDQDHHRRVSRPQRVVQAGKVTNHAGDHHSDRQGKQGMPEQRAQYCSHKKAPRSGWL